MTNLKPKPRAENKPLYSGWYCPRCPNMGTFINMASQKDIDEHLSIHAKPRTAEGWELTMEQEWVKMGYELERGQCRKDCQA